MPPYIVKVSASIHRICSTLNVRRELAKKGEADMLNNWRIATLLRSSLSFLKGGWRGGRAIVILSRLAFQSALSRSGPSGADCAHHRFLERLLDFVSLVNEIVSGLFTSWQGTHHGEKNKTKCLLCKRLTGPINFFFLIYTDYWFPSIIFLSYVMSECKWPINVKGRYVSQEHFG